MGIFDIFTNTNAQDAANAQIQGIQTGYNDLTTQFNQGRDALTTNYAAALQPFQQNYATAQQGTTALGNALGLNGPQGNASATQAFWNNPAIASQLQIGDQNVLRNQAATGQLNSGATNVDLQNLGQATAAQGWNQYVNNLQPFLGAGNAAASGIAGVDTGLGSSLNQSFTNQGNAAFGAATGQANAQANADLANNAASANIWNMLMGGAKLGVSGAGSASGGGGGSGGTIGGNLLSSAGTGISNLGSSLFSLFSDERLKEDIEPVGELYDGSNVYRYRYKGDPTPRIGLMAQEVEQRTPGAVVEIAGYKAVNYGKATQYASELGKFLEAA
jgi:hypothetical protein